MKINSNNIVWVIPSFTVIIVVVIIIINFFFKKINSSGYISQNQKTPVITTIFFIKNQKNQNQFIFILYKNFKKNYFYFYYLNSKAVVFPNKNFRSSKVKKLFSLKDKEIIFYVESNLDTKIDEKITINADIYSKVLDLIGGVDVFNLYSTNFSEDIHFIDKTLYSMYIDGVETDFRLYVKHSFWVDFLLQGFQFSHTINQADWFLKSVFSLIESTLNWTDFKILFRSLLNEKEIDDYLIFFQKMNIEEKEYQSKKYYTILEEGRFDSEKIKQNLLSIIEGVSTPFPVVLKVFNTTDVKNLARTVAYFLRWKKCNIKGELNSFTTLLNTVLVDRVGNSFKRKYLSEVLGIERFYYLVDYRERIDYSLYLGGDYKSIIKNLKKTKK